MGNKKKILIPGGKPSDLALVEAAHKLGMYVITSGYETNAPAHRYSDKYICADYSKMDEILAIAEREKIDYMCSAANDIALVTTTYVCDKLGLPGHDSYETTLILHHKDKFKVLAKELRLHVPEGEWFEDEGKAVEYALSRPYPVIIKPIDLAGGAGISKAETAEERVAGVKKAFSASRGNKVVIERFVTGTAHSFSTFIIDHKVVAVYSDNEYSLGDPYRISTSAGPATGIEKVKDILVEETERVASHLNLVDGRLHTQYIFADGRPYILEMTRRTSGDYYSNPASKALGLDTPSWIVKAECGMNLKDFPANVCQQGFHGRHCLLAPRNGRIKNITISQELENCIYDRCILWSPGFEIKNCKTDIAGIIFFHFESEEQMLDIISRIRDLISFEYYD